MAKTASAAFSASAREVVPACARDAVDMQTPFSAPPAASVSPSTAGLLACGYNGNRWVTIGCRSAPGAAFPEMSPVASTPSSPLTVAGAAADLASMKRAAPHSLEGSAGDRTHSREPTPSLLTPGGPSKGALGADQRGKSMAALSSLLERLAPDTGRDDWQPRTTPSCTRLNCALQSSEIGMRRAYSRECAERAGAGPDAPTPDALSANEKSARWGLGDNNPPLARPRERP